MKKNKIITIIALTFLLIFTSFTTVAATAKQKTDYNCTSNTVTSQDQCIQNLYAKFTPSGEDLFTLTYTFEVTGLSGGDGESTRAKTE